MPTNTPFLGMKTYTSTTDGSATFATFRADIAGISTTSNFNLLDTFCQNYSASVVALQGKSVYVIPAVYVSSNYYEANGISGITSLTTNMLIDLSLDTTNVGTVTLNINSLGIKTLKKVDASGNYVDLDSNDLLKSKENLFRYNGTYFIWIGQSSGGGGIASIAGSGIMSDTSGSVVKHNVSGVTPGTYTSLNATIDDYGHITAASNGASASSTGAPADTPFLVSGSVSVEVTNAKQLIAGSYMSLTPSGSTLIVAGTCVPLTDITGSSVMSDTTGSTVKHNYSGVTAGSANKVQYDSFGHIISASIVPVPQTATITAGQALQAYDSTTGVFGKVAIPTTSGSYSGKVLSGYDASNGNFTAIELSSGSNVSLSSISASSIVINNVASFVTPPISSSAVGVLGQIKYAIDGDVYVCTSGSSWRRLPSTDDFTSEFLPVTIASASSVSAGIDETSLITPKALRDSGRREAILANRTYFVSASAGNNNSTTGYCDTSASSTYSGSPLLTIQYAIDSIAKLDTGIYSVTIQLLNGTYAESPICKNILGSGTVTITGNPISSSMVIIDGGFSKTYPYTSYSLQNFKFKKITSENTVCISSNSGANIDYSNIIFDTGYTYHIISSGGRVSAMGNYTISGSASYHIFSAYSGYVNISGKTVTVTGTPITYFVFNRVLGMVYAEGCTFSGSTVGNRYYVSMNGAIFTNGGGETYLPGNTSGTSGSGGIYY